jgi:hypothetical protein
MRWAEQMKRDAARLAWPNAPVTADETVDVVADFEPNWSETTPGRGFTIMVIVRRDGDHVRSRSYENSEAVEFFHSLMKAGS